MSTHVHRLPCSYVCILASLSRGFAVACLYDDGNLVRSRSIEASDIQTLPFHPLLPPLSPLPQDHIAFHFSLIEYQHGGTLHIGSQYFQASIFTETIPINAL